jgi:hypothetical protein
MSTGNDIVALGATDRDRTCRYRFYSRILSPAEFSLYDRLSSARLSFHSFVWLLWSIKESAYKYSSRSKPDLVFAPLKIGITLVTPLDDFFEALIPCGSHMLYSRSFVTEETIMTIVSGDRDFSDTRWGLHRIADPKYASQSSKVRAFALESLTAALPDTAFRIVKTPGGPPVLWGNDHPTGIPISFAHHDRYVAWCYRLNNSSYRKSAAN